MIVHSTKQGEENFGGDSWSITKTKITWLVILQKSSCSDFLFFKINFIFEKLL